MAVSVPLLPSLGVHDHVVEFYETEEFLVDTVAGSLGPALHDGAAAIVVATGSHRHSFDVALRSAGVDTAAAAAAGRYLTFDAAQLLTTFMVEGNPDGERFRHSIGGAIDKAAASGGRVWIYGEMVALLWEAGDVGPAIALEDLWNDLAAAFDFALLCAYPLRVFEDEASAAGFRRVCEQHTIVIPGEDYTRPQNADEQRRSVARLQQEAAALRTEVAHLRDEKEILAELAYVDALTGLGNRRAFDLHIEREWALSIRDGVDSYVLVADLDGFKAYNDRYGHLAGDEALRRFARALRVAARGTDLLARIGGDEFGILLVRCNESAAHSFKARVGAAMAEAGMGDLRASLGHASLYRSTSATRALERADLAMFARKRAARVPRFDHTFGRSPDL